MALAFGEDLASCIDSFLGFLVVSGWVWGEEEIDKKDVLTGMPIRKVS